MKVIAEVGSNWKTLDDCLNSIRIAKECGADAVKFQLFNDIEMYGYGDDPAEHFGVTPCLHPSWIKPIHAQCSHFKIEFMCTAFSSDGYKVINPFVETHKIASAEITDLNILKTVNCFKKPVYLSTGGASLHQISAALDELKDCKVTIMYCVTAYPAKVIDFNELERIRFAIGHGYDYGYSDHSIDALIIPMLARVKGCTVIEKHVNFTDHTDTNDAPHSLNAKEFKLMVRNLRNERISVHETFTPCTWQRKPVEVEGRIEYFRPR